MTDRTSLANALAAALAAASALLVAGCLDVPDGPAPMCSSTRDCDRTHGEVCEEGVCWGNPPPGPFAAVLAPPSSRHDLVPRELVEVPIPDYGWMGDLALEAPVILGGRVVAFCATPPACDSTSLAATITVSRATQFQGGPGFNTVVNVKAGESFAIPVPRTQADDPPYTVVVAPDRATLAPAAQLPPLHVQVAATDSMTRVVTLGGSRLHTIEGVLTDAIGRGLANYRLVALGRWDVTAPTAEVSTVAVTDATGFYKVTLSSDLAGPVELVARPAGNALLPTVNVTNVDASRSSTRNITVPDNLGGASTLEVEVRGRESNGTLGPVRGAQVSVTGTLTSTLTSFTVTDQQTTNAEGKVTLRVLDGAGISNTYRLSVTPPAGSTLGVVFNQKSAPGAPIVPGTPVRIDLPPRIALRGRIVDSTGKPIPNVVVTARPALRFLWTLEAAPQDFVAATPFTTAATPNLDQGDGAGDFVVWVDAKVSQVWGHYDLLIEPPATSRAPAYVWPEVAIPRDDSESVELGDVVVPEAAFVHGRITGPDGEPVKDAELRLYRVSTALTLCGEVANPPSSCPIPAQLESRGASDEGGMVRLRLPRLP